MQILAVLKLINSQAYSLHKQVFFCKFIYGVAFVNASPQFYLWEISFEKIICMQCKCQQIFSRQIIHSWQVLFTRGLKYTNSL